MQSSINNLFLISLILLIINCLPQQQIINLPFVQFQQTQDMPGEIAYSGYLKTKVEGRQIHYVFAQSRKNPGKAPLTIWFNGGPGCSSLIGYLQQIGPYIVGNKYKKGVDNLTKNEFSWNQISNLLFLQSPALVGFSTDKNASFQYNDTQTADDAFAAILDFFQNKAPEFQSRGTILAGQNYAGKYIPDVATRILAYNQNLTDKAKGINLTGLLIGNGVMNFMDNSFEKSKIEYMIEHDFVDDRLQGIYKDACLKDFDSPRCKYFQYELKLDQDNVNPYNVYEFCKQGKSASTIRMIQSIAKLSSINRRKLDKRIGKGQPGSLKLDQINECPSDDGAIQYFNSNKKQFHVEKVGKQWQLCKDIKYKTDLEGSMRQYIKLFLSDIKIWLYNGDWDDVVPYRDTEKNLDLLQKKKVGSFEDWHVDKHHAGFYQDYDGKLTVITVKGASHLVPQSNPKQSYQMFYNFVNNRTINTPVF